MSGHGVIGITTLGFSCADRYYLGLNPDWSVKNGSYLNEKGIANKPFQINKSQIIYVLHVAKAYVKMKYLY